MIPAWRCVAAAFWATAFAAVMTPGAAAPVSAQPVDPAAPGLAPAAAPSAVSAVEAVPAQAPVACELHVWPSNGLRSVYYGWFHGGTADGAVTGRDGYPPIPKDPMPTALQAELLARAGLPSLVQMPRHTLIVHPEVLDSRTIRTSTTRITPSQSPCYAELIIDDLFFQQDVISGGYLKSLLRFRNFGREAAPMRIFGTHVQTRLLRFPPKPDRPQDNSMAMEELRSAFQANLIEFGAALAKPPKPAATRRK